MISRLLRASIFISVAVLLAATPSFAGNCSWTLSPTAMAFGTYSVFSTTNLATSVQFSFRCTPNQYANVKLTRGNSNQYVPTRWMVSGGNTANYNIFLDAAGAQVWGDANAGSYTYDVYNSTPQNKDFVDYMYGIMPSGQDLAVGSYQDIIYVTLSYSGSSTGPFTSLAPVQMTVSATVNRECRVDTFDLNFGTYNPFATTPLTKTSAVKVYCTKGSAPLAVSLDTGANPVGGVPAMISPTSDVLLYNPALGSTTGTSTSALVPINGGFTLTGSIPVGQNVSVGSYTDTLQAKVDY